MYGWPALIWVASFDGPSAFLATLLILHFCCVLVKCFCYMENKLSLRPGARTGQLHGVVDVQWSRGGCTGDGRALKALTADELLSTGLGQCGARQRGNQTRVGEVGADVAVAEHGAEEPPQRHDVTSRRRPRRQEVLENVVEPVWTRQHHPRTTPRHRRSCTRVHTDLSILRLWT